MNYLIIFLTFLSALSLKAQSKFDLILSDVSETGEGIIHVSSAPLSWGWTDAALLAGGALAFSILYNNDQAIFNSLEKNRGRTLNSLSDIGTTYGEPLTVALITGTIYSFGILFNDKWARETAQILTATLVPAGAVQTISKISAGRARPYLGLGSKEFEPFRRGEDYYSFVSGHTLVAVGTSLVLAKRINNNYIKGLLYGMAALGGWSRLYSRNHFSSDVFLGSALAFAASSAALNWHDKRSKSNTSYSFSIIPRINGLDLCLNF